VDFKHRNRKVFFIVRAHHLLQHFNNLTERDRSSFLIWAPMRLSQNLRDKRNEGLSKLLF